MSWPQPSIPIMLFGTIQCTAYCAYIFLSFAAQQTSEPLQTLRRRRYCFQCLRFRAIEDLTVRRQTREEEEFSFAQRLPTRPGRLQWPSTRVAARWGGGTCFSGWPLCFFRSGTLLKCNDGDFAVFVLFRHAAASTLIIGEHKCGEPCVCLVFCYSQPC